MKNTLATIIIFIIMVFTIIFSVNYLNNTCVKLNTVSTEIGKSIEDESWNKAYTESLNLFQQWEKYTRKISIFVNHAEIDNINNELLKLTQYTKCHNKEEALASNEVVKFLFKHIVNMEKINLQNIF